MYPKPLNLLLPTSTRISSRAMTMWSKVSRQPAFQRSSRRWKSQKPSISSRIKKSIEPLNPSKDSRRKTKSWWQWHPITSHSCTSLRMISKTPNNSQILPFNTIGTTLRLSSTKVTLFSWTRITTGPKNFSSKQLVSKLIASRLFITLVLFTKDLAIITSHYKRLRNFIQSFQTVMKWSTR